MGSSDDIEILGVPISDPDRVVWPDCGLTKRALALYYAVVAERMMPFVQGRPLGLVTCRDIRRCRYEAHDAGTVRTVPPLRLHRIPLKSKLGEYHVVEEPAGLVAMVQLGAVEFHTWNSTVAHLEEPDRIVMDLDPAPDLGRDAVVAAALRLRALLRGRFGLESWPKATGGKGLHVVADLSPRRSWDAAFALARSCAAALVAEDPQAYTMDFRKDRRAGRILLDYKRNYRTATAIEAWSVRARPGAPVAVPLRWDEVTASLERETVFTVLDRLRRRAG